MRLSFHVRPSHLHHVSATRSCALCHRIAESCTLSQIHKTKQDLIKLPPSHAHCESPGGRDATGVSSHPDLTQRQACHCAASALAPLRFGLREERHVVNANPSTSAAPRRAVWSLWKTETGEVFTANCVPLGSVHWSFQIELAQHNVPASLQTLAAAFQGTSHRRASTPALSRAGRAPLRCDDVGHLTRAAPQSSVMGSANLLTHSCLPNVCLSQSFPFLSFPLLDAAVAHSLFGSSLPNSNVFFLQHVCQSQLASGRTLIQLELSVSIQWHLARKKRNHACETQSICARVSTLPSQTAASPCAHARGPNRQPRIQSV